jgi:hypothetical protein
MNRKLLIFGSILLCCIILVAAKIFLFKSSSPDKDVLKFAKEMNKTCPTMVDVETRLDKVNALADNSLQFDYTLIYRYRDSVSIGSLKQYMEPVILNKIKTSPELSRYLTKNLTWIYSYKDMRGDFIFKITYTPEQFK